MHSARKGSPNTGSHTSGDKFDRFEKWLRDNGARFDQVREAGHPSVNTPSNILSLTFVTVE